MQKRKESLFKLAEKKKLPSYQFTDIETVTWIRKNRPKFGGMRRLNLPERAAKEFFTLCLKVFPFPIAFVLTDNGSEFMKHFDDELRRLHMIHYHTYPKTPKMNAHCEWLIACGGGCAYQRWLNGGFGAQFPQCNIRRELFRHIKRKVGDLAKYKTVMIDS